MITALNALNNNVNALLKELKYFIEFSKSFENLLKIWDLVTISWNRLIGALINLINKVSCILLLNETNAKIIK